MFKKIMLLIFLLNFSIINSAPENEIENIKMDYLEKELFKSKNLLSFLKNNFVSIFIRESMSSLEKLSDKIFQRKSYDIGSKMKIINSYPKIFLENLIDTVFYTNIAMLDKQPIHSERRLLKRIFSVFRFLNPTLSTFLSSKYNGYSSRESILLSILYVHSKYLTNFTIDNTILSE